MRFDRAALERLRLSRGWSRQDLADVSGVSAETVRNMEMGNIARPWGSTVRAVATALEVEPVDLYVPSEVPA